MQKEKWNPNVKLNNVEMIEKAYGMKIELEDNEQVLPKSKKRAEIYEVEASNIKPGSKGELRWTN